MRHRNTGRKFGRTSSHRKALMMNLCNALIEHEVIKTTLAKAKELRRFVEPMITTAKADTLAGRRLMFSRLRSRDAVVKLFSDLGPRFEKRPGGYVRVLKCGFRVGDNAPMAIVEMVERQEDLPAVKVKQKKEQQPVVVEQVESSKKPTKSKTAKSEEHVEQKTEAKKSAAPKKAKVETKAEKPKAKKASKEVKE